LPGDRDKYIYFLSDNPSFRESLCQIVSPTTGAFCESTGKEKNICYVYLKVEPFPRKKKKTFLKDEKSVVQTIFKVLDLIRGGLDFAFLSADFFPPCSHTLRQRL